MLKSWSPAAKQWTHTLLEASPVILPCLAGFSVSGPHSHVSHASQSPSARGHMGGVCLMGNSPAAGYASFPLPLPDGWLQFTRPLFFGAGHSIWEGEGRRTEY